MKIQVDKELFEEMVSAINAFSVILYEYAKTSRKPEMVLNLRDTIIALHKRAKMELNQPAYIEENTEIPDTWVDEYTKHNYKNPYGRESSGGFPQANFDNYLSWEELKKND